MGQIYDFVKESGSSDYGGVWDPKSLKCRYFQHCPSKNWVISDKMSYGQVRYLQSCPKAGLHLVFTAVTPKNSETFCCCCISHIYGTFWSHRPYIWGVPYESWRPDDSENVMVFHAPMFSNPNCSWSSERIYWKAVILYFRFDRIKSYWWKRQKKKRKHTCTRILLIKTHLRECMCIVYVCRWSIKLKQIFMQTLCVQTKFLNPVPVATIKNTTKVWCQCSNAKIGFHQLPTNRTPTIQVEWQDRYIVILM